MRRSTPHPEVSTYKVKLLSLFHNYKANLLVLEKSTGLTTDCYQKRAEVSEQQKQGKQEILINITYTVTFFF